MGAAVGLRAGLVAGLLASGLLASAPGDAAPPPSIFSYTRPATYESAESTVMVPTRDGTRLACDLYRPARGGVPVRGRFPAVIHEYTPYGFPVDSRLVADRPETGTTALRVFSTRGYVGVSCSIRGTGLSEGTFPGWFSQVEITDNYDLVEWIARQPWSDGKVGQEGTSYGGTTALRVAALRPPHLLAVAPMGTPENAYHDIFFPGGVRGGAVNFGASLMPTTSMARGGQDQALVWQQHPLLDDYWVRGSVQAGWGRIQVPVLMIGGWFDYMRRGDVLNYQALRRNAWMITGPWEHNLPFNEFWGPGDGSYATTGAGNPGAAPLDYMNPGVLLAWFDRWLKGMRTAPLPPSRVSAFELPVVGGRHWRQLPDFPPPGTRPLRQQLRSDGTLGTNAGTRVPLSYAVNPADGPSTICFPPLGTEYPLPCDPQRDMSDVDARRLTFTGQPLRQDLVVAGQARARLRVALGASDGNLVVKLSDVAPDGSTREITVGYLKASHRLSHSRTAEVVPGTPYDVTVELEPIFWRVVRGHRLRVSLTSGDYPRIEADAPLGTVTVTAGASYIDVPVVGGKG